MILTCPECATSYFVDDASIPPTGRTVRCTNCGARWSAVPDHGFAPIAEPVAEPAPPPEPEPEFEAPVVAQDEPVADAIDDLIVEERPAPQADPDPAAEAESATVDPAPADAPAQPRARPIAPVKSDAGGAAAPWIVMGALLMGLAGGAVLMRAQVARIWPQSSAAYALLGLPVNGLGLTIEDVHAQPSFQGGQPVLSVTGVVRNPEDHTIVAPPLRISLNDKTGKTIAVKVSRPLNAGVPAGARRYFSIAISDPPSGVRELAVTFEAVATPAPAKDGAHAAAAHE